MDTKAALLPHLALRIDEEKEDGQQGRQHGAAVRAGASPRWMRLATPSVHHRTPIDLELPSDRAAAATNAATTAGKPVPPASSGVAPALHSRAFHRHAAQVRAYGALQSVRISSLTAAENSRVQQLEARQAAIEQKADQTRLAQLPLKPLGRGSKRSSLVSPSAIAAAASSLSVDKARRELQIPQTSSTAGSSIPISTSSARPKKSYTGRALQDGVYLKQYVKSAGDSMSIGSDNLGEMHYFKMLLAPVTGTGALNTGPSSGAKPPSEVSAAASSSHAHNIYPSVRVEIEAEDSGCVLRLLASTSEVSLTSSEDRGCNWWNRLESKQHGRLLALHIKGGGTIANMTTGTQANSCEHPVTIGGTRSGGGGGGGGGGGAGTSGGGGGGKHVRHSSAPLVSSHGFTTSQTPVVPQYGHSEVLDRYTGLASLTRDERGWVRNEGCVVLFLSVWSSSHYRIRATTSVASALAPIQHGPILSPRHAARAATEAATGRAKRQAVDLGDLGRQNNPNNNNNNSGNTASGNAGDDAAEGGNNGGGEREQMFSEQDLSALHDLKQPPLNVFSSSNVRQALAQRLALLSTDAVALDTFQRRVDAIKTSRKNKLIQMMVRPPPPPMTTRVSHSIQAATVLMQEQNRRASWNGNGIEGKDGGEEQKLEPLSPTALTAPAAISTLTTDLSPSLSPPLQPSALLLNRRLVRQGGAALRSRHAAWVSAHSQRLQEARQNLLQAEEARRVRTEQLAREIERASQRVQERQAQTERELTARDRTIWEEQQREGERERAVTERYFAGRDKRISEYEQSLQAKQQARHRRVQQEQEKEAQREEEAYQARRNELNGIVGCVTINLPNLSRATGSNGSSGSNGTGGGAHARVKSSTIDRVISHALTTHSRKNSCDSGVVGGSGGGGPNYDAPVHHFSPPQKLLGDDVGSAHETEDAIVARLRAQIEEGLMDHDHSFLQSSLGAAQQQAAQLAAERDAKVREQERVKDTAERERDAAVLGALGFKRAVGHHSRANSFSTLVATVIAAKNGASGASPAAAALQVTSAGATARASPGHSRSPSFQGAATPAPSSSSSLAAPIALPPSALAVAQSSRAVSSS